MRVRNGKIEDNRVICPKCGSKEEFDTAYDYKQYEQGSKLIQFYVRCKHKISEDAECNCCLTYLLNMNTGERYSLDAER